MLTSRPSRLAVLLALVFVSVTLAVATTPILVWAGEIQIKPAGNVDERLFLVRLLETMYDTWPSDATDQKAFVAAVADHRATAIRMREHCRREKLGADLEVCFNEFVESLEAYTDFLVNIGRIRKEAAEQAKKDEFKAGFGAGISGAGTYGAMRQNDYSTGEAAAGAIIVGGIQYLVDSWDKAEKREAAERQAVEAAARRVQDRISASLANAQATARKLAKANGWGKTEAGFELDEQQATQVQKLVQQRNIRALLRLYDEAVQSRPRDPFLRLSRNLHRAIADEGDVEAIVQHAKDCIDAASLVPEGDIYDEYRGWCVSFAGLLAAEARGREANNGVKPYGSTLSSQLAVRCYDWLIKNGARDTTGEIGEKRAWCLVADGQLDAAFEQANKVLELRKNSGGFAYNYACLMSRMELTDKALEWLKWAINQGSANISHIKADPDLENLRRKNAAGFAEAIKVTWDWRIVWGLFNDDIVLTNQSKFPITGVVLNARLEQDGKVWTREMKTNAILPGQSHKWENVVSIPGSRLTKSTATLICDQNK